MVHRLRPAGGAGNRHVSFVVEVGHRRTEDHGEVDGRRMGRVVLTRGLVDGYRWAGVVRDGVVGRGRGDIWLAGCVMRLARGDRGDHRSTPSHPADGHVVGLAGTRDGSDQRPGSGTGDSHVAGGEVSDCLAEHDGEVDGRRMSRVGLRRRLVDGDRWAVVVGEVVGRCVGTGAGPGGYRDLHRGAGGAGG